MRFYSLIVLLIMSWNVLAQEVIWKEIQISTIFPRDKMAVITTKTGPITLKIGTGLFDRYSVKSIANNKIIVESDDEIIWLITGPTSKDIRIEKFLKHSRSAES